MKLQQFESSFYALLNVCISIKNELNRNSTEHNYFKERYDELLKSTYGKIKNEKHPTEFHETAVSNYMILFLHYKGELSHYFKSIYRLLKIIDASCIIDDNEKIFYSKILRAQLTEHELMLMNYNYHSLYALKAKNIIYKYNILKHTQPLSKIEFRCKYKTANENPILISFIDFLCKMLEENINLFCDNYDIHEQEKRFDKFNCTIKISYNDNVCVDITCFEKQKLPPSFENIIYDYLYDKLFISQYRLIDDGIISQSTSESKGVLFLNYTLNEKQIGKINIDK
jgi:hypothetical protein